MSKIKKVHRLQRLNIMKNKLTVVYTTITSLKAAESLAASAVEAKVAACVNIIPGCMSIYNKEGKIMTGTECYLIFKTTPTKATDLKSWLKDNHPYDTPAIIEWDAQSSPEFFDYIDTGMNGYGPN